MAALALFAFLTYRYPGKVTFLVLGVFYLYAGFHLDRLVVRRVIRFHPIYNTLSNVTRTKLRLFLFWPVLYIGLFSKLALNRML